MASCIGKAWIMAGRSNDFKQFPIGAEIFLVLLTLTYRPNVLHRFFGSCVTEDE